MNDLLQVFKALSDETRLRIIKLLEHGELCVCDIVASLDIIQPKISFHLGVLKEAGLVKDRRVGKWIHYRLDDSEKSWGDLEPSKGRVPKSAGNST